MSEHRRFLDDHLPDPPLPNREGVVVLPSGRGIGWAEFGDPDGDALLWFHGTPGARKQVPPTIQEVARRLGFRVVAVERPGTGLSTPWAYHQVVDFTDDVDRVADELGIGRLAAVGLSGGGPFVLACAARLPDRVVAGGVLGGIGPTVGPEACRGYTRLLGLAEPFLRVTSVPLGELLGWVVRPARVRASTGLHLYSGLSRKAEREALRQPAVKAMFLADLCSAAEGGLRAAANDALVFARPWGFSVRDIRVPVRFWHGDADGIVPLSHSRELVEKIPGSDLVVRPGGGHFAGFLEPDDVLGWVREQWTAAARPTGTARVRRSS